MNKLERKTGIWIDKREAYIITLFEGNSDIKHLKSYIETYQPKGGSRSKTVYGPVTTIKEKSYVEREKQQTRKFLQRVCAEISDHALLYIIGPAQMKDRLEKFIVDLPQPRPKIMQSESEDSITPNQMVAKVKAFYGE